MAAPAAVIHTAAQPSHDWAASDPQTDFAVNANGTMNLLEATRQLAPDATFIFTSTNKVYGDTPNFLPLVDVGERLELPADHQYFGGIDTTMSIDRSMHSLFGVSKVAADLMVQEYGRYFDMPTVCFRGGCLTGPSHAGAQLHGFLSYLMSCAVTGTPYTVFGYDGKQVRDNIHSNDVVSAFEAFVAAPRAAAVYNLGGGRESNCSMREAIAACERISGRKLHWTLLRRGADGRSPLVDLRPVGLPARLPGLGTALRPRDDPARDPRRQPRALGGLADLAQAPCVDVVDEAAHVLVRMNGLLRMRLSELRTSASRSLKDSGDHVGFCRSRAAGSRGTRRR